MGRVQPQASRSLGLGSQTRDFSPFCEWYMYMYD